MDKPVKLTFRAAIIRDGEQLPAVTVHGRAAWALLSLIRAGRAGCTPIMRPAPRWSHYVYQLRGAGFNVETIHEPHQGSFPGHHANYLLRDVVTILPGGTLDAYLTSPEGRRDFPGASFARAA
jgi:hypothetical protein